MKILVQPAAPASSPTPSPDVVYVPADPVRNYAYNPPARTVYVCGIRIVEVDLCSRVPVRVRTY
jgi:hypothetical protein